MQHTVKRWPNVCCCDGDLIYRMEPICGLLFQVQGSVRTAWPLLFLTAPSPGRLYTAEETEPVMPNSAGNKVCLGNLEDEVVCISGLWRG